MGREGSRDTEAKHAWRGGRGTRAGGGGGGAGGGAAGGGSGGAASCELAAAWPVVISVRLAASRAGPVLVAVLLAVSRAGPVALAVLEAPIRSETAIGAVLPLISVSKMERQYSSALSSVSLLLVAEKEVSSGGSFDGGCGSPPSGVLLVVPLPRPLPRPLPMRALVAGPFVLVRWPPKACSIIFSAFLARL